MASNGNGGILARRRRKRVRTAIALIALLAVAGAAAWFTLGRQKDDAAPTYATSEVATETVVVSASGSGSLIVVNEAEVSPSVSGTVKEIHVSLGEKVGKGDTLYTIDNDSLDDDVAKALASLRSSQESLERAKLEELQAEQALDELESREGTGAPSDTDIDVAEQKVSSAEAGVRTAQASLSSARRSYYAAQETAGERTVTAPISGVITTLDLSEGDEAGGSSSSGSSNSASSGGTASGDSGTTASSSTGSLVISDISSMRARVELSEVDVKDIKKGQKATVTIDALDGLEVAGKVVRIAETGTNTSGVVTYEVDVSLHKLPAAARPAMTVSAAVVTKVRRDVLAVPNAAVKSDDSGDYVQVIRNGTPTRTTVVTGVSNDTSTEISSGLSAGTEVVTASASDSASAGGGGGNGGPPDGGAMRMMAR